MFWNNYYYGGYGYFPGFGWGRGWGRGRGRGFGWGRMMGYCPWTGLPRGWRWMYPYYQQPIYGPPFYPYPYNQPQQVEETK